MTLSMNQPLHNSGSDHNSPRNTSGGSGYSLEPHCVVTTLALTLCPSTAQTTREEELSSPLVNAAQDVDSTFLARLAGYCRHRRNLREAPALLCAVLADREGDIFRAAAGQVLDDLQILRRFGYYAKSGLTGRISYGSRLKKFFQRWIDAAPESELFLGSGGRNPSVADLIRLSHPRPKNARRESFYAYLLGRNTRPELLPQVVREFEEFRADSTAHPPDLPVNLLLKTAPAQRELCEIAFRAGWRDTLQYLNAFARGGVFDYGDLSYTVAERLRDPEELRANAAGPEVLFAALGWADPQVPDHVQQALEAALDQVLCQIQLPDDLKIAVALDVSGSMHCPCRFRPGDLSNGAERGSVKLLDLAALFAGGLLQNSLRGLLLGFDEKAWVRHFETTGSALLKEIVHTSGIGAGRSDCAAPLRLLNEKQEKRDLVVLISDNQSWADVAGNGGGALLEEWNRFRTRNPQARLICLDLQPEGSAPWPQRRDVLCLSARSERVFPVITEFAAGLITTEDQVREIRRFDQLPLPGGSEP
jgi:60 kDa SS-A/Ro ribonucleoprotein